MLADTNEELINAYRIVKRDPEAVEAVLNTYQKKHNEQFYYSIRDEIPRDDLARAARFIYLNRTCFNGMYRVNRSGAFNVPIGTKNVVAFQGGYLDRVSPTV